MPPCEHQFDCFYVCEQCGRTAEQVLRDERDGKRREPVAFVNVTAVEIAPEFG